MSKITRCVDCAYCGDKHSFEQPNNLIEVDPYYPKDKHYYCNCGDSKYYHKDITGKMIEKCEDFEEI